MTAVTSRRIFCVLRVSDRRRTARPWSSHRAALERVVDALELDTLTIRIPMRLQRRGGRKLIMTPEGAAPTPKPRPDAEQEGVTDGYVCRLLPLTCLASDIVEAILDGRQPKGLRLAEMLGNGPLGW